jgi:uncharacterized membrane protein
MRTIFDKQITEIQGSPISLDFFAGILCYIALGFGLYYFILREKKPLLDAFLLGMIINAVYETTSKTFFKKWSYKIVVLDTLWGGILFTLTTFVLRKFFAF